MTLACYWTCWNAPTPPHTLHLSQFCLSVSQPRPFCRFLLPLLCQTVCLSWYIIQIEFPVISKPGQVASVEPAAHRCNGQLFGAPRLRHLLMMGLISALSLPREASLWRWILKFLHEMLKRVAVTIHPSIQSEQSGHENLYVCMTSCCLWLSLFFLKKHMAGWLSIGHCQLIQSYRFSWNNGGRSFGDFRKRRLCA